MCKRNKSDTPEDICGEIVRDKNYFEKLKDILIKDLQDIFKKENLDVAVTGRIKESESLLKKVIKKEYKDFKQITDYLGLRVIVKDIYDIQRVCDVLTANNEFKINSQSVQYLISYDESPNKTAELGIDKVGYRAVHYVLKFDKYDLKSASLGTLEFSHSIKIEVQIKTELENFWADNTHDKVYKSRITYNCNMKRRFNLLSGLLETVDYELSNIEKERHQKLVFIEKLINQYLADGSILDDPLNEEVNILDETSLYLFMQTFIGQENEFLEESVIHWLKFLKNYKISTVIELLDIIKSIDNKNPSCKLNEMLKLYITHKRTMNGVLRNILIIYDLDRFCAVVNLNPKEYNAEKVFSLRGSLQLYGKYNITEDMLEKKGFVIAE